MELPLRNLLQATSTNSFRFKAKIWLDRKDCGNKQEASTGEFIHCEVLVEKRQEGPRFTLKVYIFEEVGLN